MAEKRFSTRSATAASPSDPGVHGMKELYDALLQTVALMPDYIDHDGESWTVLNPIQERENFADKWNEYPERREAFMQWLKKVETDFIRVSRAETLSNGLIMLDESLGRETMTKVGSALGVPRSALIPAVVNSLPVVPALGDAGHAQAPQWPVVPKYRVKVSAGVYFKKGSKRRLWALGNSPLPKKVWLRFEAISDVPEPYSIQWQVVNTGQEADRAGQPRGDFYESNSDKRVRWETTAYRGTHWVEAFVLKAGVCVARSGRVLVRIR